MITQQTITEADLDAAIKAREKTTPDGHTKVCIMAQFAKRLTGRRVAGSTCSSVAFMDEPAQYSFRIEGGDILVHGFDEGKFAMIRKLLPRLVQVDYDKAI